MKLNFWNEAENIKKIIKIDLWEVIDWIFGGKYKGCRFILQVGHS